MTGKDIALAIARAAEDKKADDIQILDMRGVMVDTDYFVICSASSMAQLRAITNEIIEKMEEAQIKLAGHEGRNNNAWALLDYTQVVAHLFLQEERDYYNLEKLWADAKRIN